MLRIIPVIGDYTVCHRLHNSVAILPTLWFVLQLH